MSIINTLIYDRTQADVSALRALMDKAKTGTITNEEWAVLADPIHKGAYNYTDLNRVTAALDYLAARLRGYGYAVPGYQRIEIPRKVTSNRRLPEGHTELKWIESTGTQYIDTGFMPNQSSAVVLDVCFPNAPTSHSALFGVRNANTNQFWCYYRYNDSSYSIRYATNTDKFIAYDATAKATVTVDANVLTVNGESVSSTEGAFTSEYAMALFAANNAGTIQYYGAFKLYACQIYDNGTLVRDYVPDLTDDGQIGLYDLVEGKFYPNAGTGLFMMGPPRVELPDGYTQLEYIESSGTQYIDTKFVPNQDTRLVLDADIINADNWGPMFGSRDANVINEFGMFANNPTSVYQDGYANGAHVNISATSVLGHHVFDKNKNVTSIDGVVKNTFSQATFTGSHSIYLFQFNTNGATVNYQISMRSHICQIYDNGVLVRYYIPCRNPDGEAGLYDVVNATFAGNAGTGAFTEGAEVTWEALPEDVEYDPYTWYESDIPRPTEMVAYLSNAAAIRAALAVLPTTPDVPADMDDLQVEEANAIERILVDVDAQLRTMATTFIPAGEAISGGDNL